MKTALYKCETCDSQYRQNLDGTPVTVQWNCWKCLTITTFKRVRGTTKDNIHKVFIPLHNKAFVVDEDASECDMRSNLPHFFENAPKGSRETTTIYRGAIIVRQTVTFTDCQPQRLTIPYLFGKWGKRENYTVKCIRPDGGLNSVTQAKRLIDRILAANYWDNEKEPLA
jgi:hypothetical protein